MPNNQATNSKLILATPTFNTPGPKSKLILLDSHALIHRAFHAIHYQLTTSNNEPTNVVFGFISIFLNIWETEKPDFVAAALDLKGPTFRHQADQNYKKNRPQTPPELIQQIKHIHEFFKIFRIPLFSQKGLEADDILATLVTRAQKNPQLNIIIISSDHDLLQLVTEKVSVHNLHGGYRKSINFSPQKVQTEFGFAPKFIPDFKGLAGDPSDNLNGVNGIGKKTATKLIQEFGPLENIYQNLTKIPVNPRQKLIQDQATAFHSKKMATLVRDAELNFDLQECQFPQFAETEVLKFFQKLELFSLISRYQKILATTKTSQISQTSLFD